MQELILSACQKRHGFSVLEFKLLADYNFHIKLTIKKRFNTYFQSESISLNYFQGDKYSSGF